VGERRNAFVDEESVDIVHSQILRTCAEKDFAELAALFMPDHVHLILAGEHEGSAFLPFMKLMRQRTAMSYRKLKNQLLWQDGYFERVLRPDDSLSRIVEYMLENPVRAGLVARPEDYPFAYRRNFSSASGSSHPHRRLAST
jgi:putative transposase